MLIFHNTTLAAHVPHCQTDVPNNSIFTDYVSGNKGRNVDYPLWMVRLICTGAK